MSTKSRSRHDLDKRRLSAMAALIFFLAFVGVLVVAGIVSAMDMRPQLRPPEWSVGRLIEPRH
jgi:hypothetical protein